MNVDAFTTSVLLKEMLSRVSLQLKKRSDFTALKVAAFTGVTVLEGVSVSSSLLWRKQTCSTGIHRNLIL